MASLQERNGSYRILFCHHGKLHSFTLGKVEKDEALNKARQADYLQKSFWLNHSGEFTIEIAHTETSCDCLEVIVASKLVHPKEKVLTTLTLDFSHKPSFVGNLELKVSGYTKAKGEVAFEVFAEVSVNDMSE